MNVHVDAVCVRHSNAAGTSSVAFSSAIGASSAGLLSTTGAGGSEALPPRLDGPRLCVIQCELRFAPVCVSNQAGHATGLALGGNVGWVRNEMAVGSTRLDDTGSSHGVVCGIEELAGGGLWTWDA